MNKDDLDKLRKEIDEIDGQLLDLFNRRADLVLKVGQVKQQMGLKLFDPEREEQILSAVKAKNKGPLPHQSVARLFERVIDESRFLEHNRVYKKENESES
jgi:chorismate mutase